jgi:hypothetical protein
MERRHRQLMDIATEALGLDALDHHQQDDGERDGERGVEVSSRQASSYAGAARAR